MILKRVRTILLIVMMVAFALSFSMLNITSANANGGDVITYGEIATSIQADTTLQKIYGATLSDKIANDKDGWNKAQNTSFESRSGEWIEAQYKGMPPEKDDSPVASGYAVYLHPYYASITSNAIVFDAPISAEDMLASGGITIRMYVKISASSPFMTRAYTQDFAYGVYLYGLGVTGDFSDHFVWIPADITQHEYINFKINAYDASLLADSTGMVRGLTLAADIAQNTPGFDPYIYIKSITLNAPDTAPAVAGEIKTYSGKGGLTHVKGNIKSSGSNFYDYWDGYTPVDVVPSVRNDLSVSELPLDNGQTVDKAYRFSYHYGGCIVVGKNSVLFEKPLTIADIENSNGITLRIYAHLTNDRSPYPRLGYDTVGLFFYGYGKGITGESDDTAVVIPEDVTQDEWTDLHIPAETLKNMVGENGVMYGLNYGAYIYDMTGPMYKGNPVSNEGHVLLRKVTLEEKTYSVTFKNGEETVNSYSAVSGSEIVMATAPVVAGKVFVGWETDSKLYSNSSELTLNADVVFNAVYVSFNMGKGASIRLDEPTGIRFITYLNSADFDAVKALVGVDKVSLGVRVVRGDNTSLEIAANNTLVKGENIIFNGVIKNLTKDYYTVTYTGAGFIDITYSDNTTGRIYANANDNTRTIAQVAQAVIEDPEIDATDFYTEAQYNLLRSFYEQQEA